MIEIRLNRHLFRPFAHRGLRIMLGCAWVVALLWLAWGSAETVSAEPPWPEPPVGTRTQMPILSFVGNETTSQSLIQVQNVGSEFTRAIILIWGEPGACGPQAVGPFKIECSGIIKPGATWMFGAQQMPQGAKSGIVYTFPHEDVVLEDGTLENVADAFCERLFSEVTYDANAYRRFDLAYRQGDEIFGLPTTGGQPVAVDVVRVAQGRPSLDLTVSGAYSGIPGPEEGAFDPVFGGFAYYAPIVYADAAGLTSYLYIQNSGLDCTGVELWFQEQNDCLRAQICEIITLGPGETAQYNVSDCVGPSFVGNVWIRTSQPSGVVVDHIGQDVLMTDKGVAAQNAIFESGSEVLFGPLIYREFQGWETGVTVQNLSGTQQGMVKVYFYDQSGNIITTLVDWICPRGTQTFFLPVINGLPGQYVGAVRVESQTPFRNAGSDGPFVPIAGVAHLKKYTDPTTSAIQEAISYNLFGESETFDWQLGAGVAGLIGVPSVLKQQRSLSTELAIQNVNPLPGFTDFAIYIYDANGLLEVVCEKLSAYNVEYINFNSWGIFNPGFAGSVVISGVYTNQIPEGGDPNQNWFGLSAVAIQRVQSILQFNMPGDESSGHEAYPIIDQAFHFEGPNPPACPGVRAGCTTNVNVTITRNGEPLAGTAVQLQGGQGAPISTGTTNATGQVEFVDVPVTPGAVTTYQLWYFVPDPIGPGEWVRSVQDLVIDLTQSNVCVVSVSGLAVDVKPTADISGHAMESCWLEAANIAKLSGATVELWQEAVQGLPGQFEKVTETATNTEGFWEFTDVLRSDVFGTAYRLRMCFGDGNGNSVCFTTNPFLLGAQDAQFWFHYDASEPNDSLWCTEIAGTVFNDDGGTGTGTAGNGIPDGDEALVMGATVELYVDDGDGVANTATDTYVATATTNTQGVFKFVVPHPLSGDYFLNYPADDTQSAVFTLNDFYDGSVLDAGSNPERPNYDTGDDEWVEPGGDPVDGPGGN